MCKKTKEKEAQEVITCSICMETSARASTDCAHKFCLKCISRWTKVFMLRCRKMICVPYVGPRSLKSNMEKE